MARWGGGEEREREMAVFEEAEPLLLRGSFVPRIGSRGLRPPHRMVATAERVGCVAGRAG